MDTETPRASFLSLDDLAVLAAILGFVAYGVPLAVDILGGNPLSAPGGPFPLVLLLALLLPGAVGVWAAWRRNRAVLWVVTALVLGAWIAWWRHFVILAPVPALYVVAAVLAAVGRRRKSNSLKLTGESDSHSLPS